MSKEVELSEYNKKMRGLESQEDADEEVLTDEERADMRKKNLRDYDRYKQSVGMKTKGRAEKLSFWVVK